MLRNRILSGALVLLILLQTVLPAMLVLPAHAAAGTILYDSLVPVTGEWSSLDDVNAIYGRPADGEVAYAHWKPYRSTMAYEAVVKLGREHVAGLTLGDEDPETPYGFWAAGIDAATKTAWIRYYGENETVELARCSIEDLDLPGDRYRIRVETHDVDSMIVLIINDEYFLYANTGNENVSGYFGLLADGGGWFEEINCWIDTPEVRGMTANGRITNDPAVYRKVMMGEYEHTLRLQFEDLGRYHLTARPLNGDPGLVIDIEKQSVTVRQITESFDLLLIAHNGDITFHYVIRVEVSPTSSLQYLEDGRPQYHYTPLKGKMKAGGSVVFDSTDRQWHYFYPLEAIEGDPTGASGIAHAVSPDLLSWSDQGVVWVDASIIAIAVTEDADNTTGFFTEAEEGQSRLVAICTKGDLSLTSGIEELYIAYSTDHGATWREPAQETHGFENPIIDGRTHSYGYDMYATKLFAHDGKWMMLTGGSKVHLFTSSDLVNWSHASAFEIGSQSPDLYPVTVEGSDTVTWIFSDAGQRYIVGNLEKWGEGGLYRFVSESDRLPLFTGTINGALQVSASTSGGAGKSYLLGYAADPTHLYRWSGALTLPYQLKLVEEEDGLRLSVRLTPEANALRAESAASQSEFSDAEQAKKILQNNPLTAFDLEISFKPPAQPNQEEVRIEFLSDGIYSTSLVYDYRKRRLRLIRRESRNGSTIEQKEIFSTVFADYAPEADGTVQLRILSDGNLLEVLDRDGGQLLSALIYPESGAIGWDCTTSEEMDDGNGLIYSWDVVEYQSLRLWRMKSVWHDGETVLPEAGLYYHYERTDISKATINKEDPTYQLTIEAYVVDENGLRRNNLQWTEPDISPKEAMGELRYNVQNRISYLITKMNRTMVLTVTDEKGIYSDTLEIKSTAPTCLSNLPGLVGQYWEVGQFGLSSTDDTGYSPLLSPVSVSGSLSLWAKFTPMSDDDCMGLVFGVPVTEFVDRVNGWYCVTLQKMQDSPILTILQYDAETRQMQVLKKHHLEPNSTQQWKLKVEYDGSQLLTITVNDQAYFSNRYDIGKLSPGYMGLVSVDGYGAFTEVAYKDVPDFGSPLPLDPPEPMAPTVDDPSSSNPNRRPNDGLGNGVIYIAVGAVSLTIAFLCIVAATVWRRRRQEMQADQPEKVDYFGDSNNLPPRLH